MTFQLYSILEAELKLIKGKKYEFRTHHWRSKYEIDSKREH